MEPLMLLDATMEDNLSPGAWVYRNEELTSLEQQEIFRKSWQFIGHVSEMPSQGDYLTLEAPKIRVFAVRGEDNRIRAFENICPHRATQLLDDAKGNCGGRIRCPYHAWTFHLDGRLRGIPNKNEHFPHVDEASTTLRELETEVFHGLIFVKIGGSSPSPSRMLKDFNENLGDYKLEDLEPEIDKPIIDEVPADWKLINENDFDADHVSTIHQSFLGLVGGKLTESISPTGVWQSICPFVEKPAKLWTVRMYQQLLPRLLWLPEHLQRACTNYNIFPNLSFYIYPDRFDVVQIFPISAGKSISICRCYKRKNEDRQLRAARYLGARMGGITFAEDLDILKRVQSSLYTTDYNRGSLSSGQKGQTNFYTQIYKRLPITRLINEPRLGTVKTINENLMS